MIGAMRARQIQLLALLMGMSALVPMVVAPDLAATSVEDILQTVNQSISEDELAEPGSQVRAKAIADMMPGLKLDASQTIDLKLALAEAWLDGQQPEAAEAVIKDVLAAGPSPEQKERAGLAWVSSWQLRFTMAPNPATIPSILPAVAALGDLGVRVLARAHTAEAQRLLSSVAADGKPTQAPAALSEYDLALKLLHDEPGAERVPVYHLRLLAMEAMGMKPEAVEQWLTERQADPAAAEVAESALTSGQKLVGQPAPALKLPRIDGTAGEIAIESYKGKTVLLDFFATWCQPCAAVAPGLAAFAAKHKDTLSVLGVSLDNKDTVGAIPGWIATNAIQYPLVGDLQGWDSETIKGWHVDKIPTLILVGPDGTVKAIDLVGSTEDETVHNIMAALAQPAGGAGAAAPATAPPPAEVPGSTSEVIP